MARTIMHELRSDLELCKFCNGKIEPCNYHKKKVNSTILKLNNKSGKIIPNSSHQIHEITEDIKELSRLMANDNDPAGGWYLVEEQRNWLFNRFCKILPEIELNNSRCRILVAGIASYVHFYTFLNIIINAANNTKFNLDNIDIDVIDKCIYPLHQIAYIENRIRHRLFLKPYLRIFDQKVKIPRKNLAYLKKLRSSLRRLNVRIFLRDLRQLEDIKDLNTYSIITEHYLTTFLYKEKGLMEMTRQAYHKLLDSSGSLLVCSGIPNNQFFKEFVELHENLNLELNSESIEHVWDPYGMDRHVISSIHKNNISELVAPLENCMFEFIKKGI
ncbi:MAG: hypothetical protein ACWA5P_06305 [bacterium]